jgi:hypothetical protein
LRLTSRRSSVGRTIAATIPCSLIQFDVLIMHGIDARLSLCSPQSQSTPTSPLSRKQSIWELPRLKVQGTNEYPVAQPARRTGAVRPRNQNRTPVRKHWRDPTPSSCEFPKFFVPGYALSTFVKKPRSRLARPVKRVCAVSPRQVMSGCPCSIHCRQHRQRHQSPPAICYIKCRNVRICANSMDLLIVCDPRWS